jgi:hypothetical protein
MNKYIFLDIDGVLNHSGEDFKRYKFQVNPPYGRYVHVEFSHNNIEAFNKLIDLIGEDKIYIVISSTWRKLFTIAELMFIFKNMGIKGDIIGKTKDLGIARGYEIQEYIDNHDVSHYVILDDDSDMVFPELIEHFVQTNSWYDQINGGFIDEHIPEVLEKFKVRS